MPESLWTAPRENKVSCVGRGPVSVSLRTTKESAMSDTFVPSKSTRHAPGDRGLLLPDRETGARWSAPGSGGGGACPSSTQRSPGTRQRRSGYPEPNRKSERTADATHEL